MIGRCNGMKADVHLLHILAFLIGQLGGRGRFLLQTALEVSSPRECSKTYLRESLMHESDFITSAAFAVSLFALHAACGIPHMKALECLCFRESLFWPDLCGSLAMFA